MRPTTAARTEIEIASAGSGVIASGSQLTVQEHHAGPVATFGGRGTGGGLGLL